MYRKMLITTEKLGRVTGIAEHRALGVAGLVFVETETHRMTLAYDPRAGVPLLGDEATHGFDGRGFDHVSFTNGHAIPCGHQALSLIVVKNTAKKSPKRNTNLEKQMKAIRIFQLFQVGWVFLSILLIIGVGGTPFDVCVLLFFFVLTMKSYVKKDRVVQSQWNDVYLDQWIGVERKPTLFTTKKAR
jgi:hypothetical protein